MRGFIWEENGDEENDHLGGKKLNPSGLGMEDLVVKNIALLGKWLLRIPLEPNSLCHRNIELSRAIVVHICAPTLIFINLGKAIFGHTWKFLPSTNLDVGRGHMIRFWEDCWV